MIKQFLSVVCAGILIGSASGCVALAAVASKVKPAPTIEAEYKPAKQPTLVFVESFQNPDLYEVESERLERDIAAEFVEHKAFPVVSPQKLFDLRSSKGSEFAKMDLPAVARAVGARQIVYVNLQTFTADPPVGSETVRGEAHAVVRFVDGVTGKTLFPRDSSIGRDISFKTSALSEEGTTRDAVQAQLYRHLTEEVSHLFYNWTDESQGDYGPPSMTGNDIK